MRSTLTIAALAAMLCAAPAFAQTVTNSGDPSEQQETAQKPNPTAPRATRAARSAKSKDCSAQADQQGLHGKKRKQFRRSCMKH